VMDICLSMEQDYCTISRGNQRATERGRRVKRD